MFGYVCVTKLLRFLYNLAPFGEIYTAEALLGTPGAKISAQAVLFCTPEALLSTLGDPI